MQSNFDTAQKASAAQFDRQSDLYGKSHILADTSDVAGDALAGLSPGPGARAPSTWRPGAATPPSRLAQGGLARDRRRRLGADA